MTKTIPGTVLERYSSPPAARITRMSQAAAVMRGFQNTLRLLVRPGQAPAVRAQKMLVLIPAHNEEAAIGRTLQSVLDQSRAPDRVVVIANNCTDDTAEIARGYRGVTVIEMDRNVNGKVGALNHGWARYQAGYDFVAGVDADTVLEAGCLQQLENELATTPRPGGVMARYTFRQGEGTSLLSRMLVRLQRLEFASWTGDALRKRRRTYVLGGQATLFSAHAMRTVAARNQMNGPWDHSAQVEDMALTGDFRSLNLSTTVSADARAYAGPMLTARALWHQRRKWDEGMIRLITRSRLNTWTVTLWRQQLGLLMNGLTRVGFIFLLVTSLVAHRYVWSWIWIIPPGVAVLLNLKLAMKVPHRTAGDLLAALLLIPVEIYLIVRVCCATASWITVLSGIRRDGWEAQRTAEAGRSQGSSKMIVTVVIILLAIVGTGFGWIHTPGFIQNRVLLVGWSMLAMLTAVQVLGMLVRILRPAHGLRP